MATETQIGNNPICTTRTTNYELKRTKNKQNYAKQTQFSLYMPLLIGPMLMTFCNNIQKNFRFNFQKVGFWGEKVGWFLGYGLKRSARRDILVSSMPTLTRFVVKFSCITMPPEAGELEFSGCPFFGDKQ